MHTHRTRIEDIGLEGHALSEEHLRLASGGVAPGGGGGGGTAPGWSILLTYRGWHLPDLEADS
jgi:hypothetical protein